MTQQIQPIPEPNGAETAAPPTIRAVVHTGGREIAYLRSGSGPAVLLLCAGGAESARARTLRGALASTCRVFAPDLPCARAGASHPAMDEAATPGGRGVRLRDLVDGLGLVRPCLVADDGFALEALAFALADPHRVGRLVIVTQNPLCGGVAGDALEEVVGRAGTATLLLHSPGDGPLHPGSPVAMQMITFIHCPDGARES